MNNELLREALRIGLECAKWTQAVLKNAATHGGDYTEIDSNVCKIEAAIAALPTDKDCLTVAPTFDQAEHGTMVEKGTKAWADPADYPERCKVDPLQSLADQAQALDMGYGEPLRDTSKVEVNCEFLIAIKRTLESQRIWGGQGWHYNPIHPRMYLPTLEIIDSILKGQP